MSASARDGRRRRVLQDEILSASREMPSYTGDEPPTDGEGRRYAFAEHSVGSALARRHFPSHAMVPVGVAGASLVAVAGLVALDPSGRSLANLQGASTQTAFEMGAPGSIAHWIATAAMLTAAIACAMIFSVRRRRVDDYRGKYRLWRSAAALAVLLSLNAATGLHRVFAEIMTSLTGTQLFAGGAGWWMLAGGVAVAWVASRVLLDLRESRMAVTLFSTALIAFAITLVGHLGFSPSDSVRASLDGVALAGYALVPAALLAYMRFLRHDVAAGVATRLRVTRTVETPAVEKTPRAPTEKLKIAPETKSSTSSKRKKSRAAEAERPEEIQWTDGSEGVDDDYGDELELQGRKLNKADRKRLRKQKEARRAA